MSRPGVDPNITTAVNPTADWRDRPVGLFVINLIIIIIFANIFHFITICCIIIFTISRSGSAGCRVTRWVGPSRSCQVPPPP